MGSAEIPRRTFPNTWLTPSTRANANRHTNASSTRPSKQRSMRSEDWTICSNCKATRGKRKESIDARRRVRKLVLTVLPPRVRARRRLGLLNTPPDATNTKCGFFFNAHRYGRVTRERAVEMGFEGYGREWGSIYIVSNLVSPTGQLRTSRVAATARAAAATAHTTRHHQKGRQRMERMTLLLRLMKCAAHRSSSARAS